MTIHERAVYLYRLARPSGGYHGRGAEDQRRRAMTEAARDGRRQAEERSTAHLYRDYRPGIGSGRRADWLDIGFAHYRVTAAALHRALGLRDDMVRRAVRTIRALGGFAPLHPDAPAIPDAALNGLVGEIRARGAWEERPGLVWTAEWAGGVEPLIWRAIYTLVVSPAIGEHDAECRLAAIAARPDYTISGYLAASILAWRRGEKGYEGCSGCESYRVHRAHPEQWGLLLSRAPTGARGPEWEQVYPHEEERLARLRADGWYETLRLNDSLFTREHPVLRPIL